MTKWIALFLLFFPLTASAGEWALNGSTTKTTTGLNIGQWAHFDPITGDEDPAPLNVAACGSFSAWWYDDMSGATGSTSTVTLYSCPISTTDTVICQPWWGGTVLGATNTESLAMEAIWFFGDVSAVSNDGRLMVKCSEAGAK